MTHSSSHILVVNDDKVVTMVTAKILERHGYRVTKAKDGQAALDAIEADTPNLMVFGHYDARYGRRWRGHVDETSRAVPHPQLTTGQ